MKTWLAIIGVFLAVDAGASDLRVGGGLTYDQATLPNNGSSVSSVYRGLGWNLDLRMSFGLGLFGDDSDMGGPGLGVDVFGIYQKNSIGNVGAGLNETHARSAYGGGLDFRLSKLFLGVQYTYATVTITSGTSGGTTEFSFPLYGFRAGVTFFRGDLVQISVGGMFQTGTAVKTDNPALQYPQPMTEFGGFLLFNFRVMKSGLF